MEKFNEKYYHKLVNNLTAMKYDFRITNFFKNLLSTYNTVLKRYDIPIDKEKVAIEFYKINYDGVYRTVDFHQMVSYEYSKLAKEIINEFDDDEWKSEFIELGMRLLKSDRNETRELYERLIVFKILFHKKIELDYATANAICNIFNKKYSSMQKKKIVNKISLL